MNATLLKNPLVWSITLHAGLFLPLWLGASAPSLQGQQAMSVSVELVSSVESSSEESPLLREATPPSSVDVEEVVIQPEEKQVEIIAKAEVPEVDAKRVEKVVEQEVETSIQAEVMVAKVAVKKISLAPEVVAVAMVKPKSFSQQDTATEKEAKPKASSKSPTAETQHSAVSEEVIMLAMARPMPQGSPVARSSSKAQESSVQAWYSTLVTPRYPKLSRQRGEEGTVIVSTRITADGRAQEIRIVQSSGHRNLNKAVIKALKQSTFEQKNAGAQKLKFTFRLEEHVD